jgi:NADH-quinone oxidoreductase subunit G
MPTVYVNNEPVEIGASERLNCIQAAQKVGIDIPAYCWHPELSVVASCRMCLVEVGDKKPDGSIVMQPKLVPGCQTPAKDGTVIIENSEKVKAARKATLEYLLLNHPLDCPTCDQAGECFLQDYSYKHGRGYSRLQEEKNQKADKDQIGEQITLFTDRCIMCSRCVRFTREISGTGELQVVGRGSHEEIDIFPGQPCNNKLAGNVVDLCPVGALCSKDFLYKQRVWWLKTADSVCPGCSTGCSVHVDQNEDHLYRLRPRVNPQAQGHFMCDEGRFGWKYIHSDQRITFPEQRDVSGEGIGRVLSRGWDEILPAVVQSLKKRASVHPKKIGAILSPWMTVEEAYLLAGFMLKISPKAKLALGPVRVVGEDDKYPKDVHGAAIEPARFTIRAEKAPNRRGVETVLKSFTESPMTYGDMLAQVAAGEMDALYVVGGDPAGWCSEEDAAKLAAVPLLIVQDLLHSPVSGKAAFLLSGGSFAERDGTFINHAGLAQEIRRSVRGPDGSRPDNRILWDLCGRTGLYQGAVLRREIAKKIPALASLALGTLGDLGVKLTKDQALPVA